MEKTAAGTPRELGFLTVLQTILLSPETQLGTPRNTQQQRPQSQGQTVKMGRITRPAAPGVLPDEDCLHLRATTLWGWQSP